MLLRRLLLLPMLSPLLAALVVGALNPAPALSLRLLTWRSPALPIGLWIAGAAAGGAVLSGGATALALGDAGGGARRRWRRRQDGSWEDEAMPRFEGRASGRQERWEPFEPEQPREQTRSPWADRTAAAWGGSAGPERPPGEPAPTLAVPFRVLRRGDGAAPPTAAVGLGQRPQGRSRAARAEPAAEPVAVATDDDWATTAGDDW